MVRQASFKGLREDKPADEVEAEKPADAATTDLAEPNGPPKASSKTTVDVRTVGPEDRQRHGSANFEPDQSALAGRRQRQVCYKARPRAVLRSGRAMAHRTYKGPPLLDHQDAGRHSRPAVLVSAMQCQGLRICSNSRRFRANRKPYLQIDRVEGTGGDRAGRGGRASSLELPAGTSRSARQVRVRTSDPAPRRNRSMMLSKLPWRFCDPADGDRSGKFLQDDTGGKGLHVVTPLKGATVSWPDAKECRP